QEESEGDEPLSGRGALELELDLEAVAQRRQSAAADDLPIHRQLPLAAQVPEPREVAPVVDPEARAAGCLDVHRPRQELQLVQRRVRRPVGPDEAADAEVGAVRDVAEVAAVCPVVAAPSISTADAVVDPLPDEAALQGLVPVERGEVVGEATVAV